MRQASCRDSDCMNTPARQSALRGHPSSTSLPSSRATTPRGIRLPHGDDGYRCETLPSKLGPKYVSASSRKRTRMTRQRRSRKLSPRQLAQAGIRRAASTNGSPQRANRRAHVSLCTHPAGVNSPATRPAWCDLHSAPGVLARNLTKLSNQQAITGSCTDTSFHFGCSMATR